MSDIDWSVKSGIIDDERKLTFSYKNNNGDEIELSYNAWR